MRGWSRIGPTRRHPGGTALQLLGLGLGGGVESIEYSVCGNRYVVLFYDLVIEEENTEKLQERE